MMIKEHMMCTAKRADSDEFVTGYFIGVLRHAVGVKPTIAFSNNQQGGQYDEAAIDPSTLEHVAVKVTEKLNGTKEEFWCPNCDVYMGDADNYVYDECSDYCSECGQRLEW